nr:uncharacterized protein LOC117681692 isoform X2 [Crassostrea gigas]
MKETKDEPNVEIVVETERCCKVVSILSRETVLAVDCLGVQLGSRGPLTLIQVGTYSGDVYLFDVLKNKKLINDGELGTLLESKDVKKTQCDKYVAGFWAIRPLTNKMISYAVGNVRAMIPEVYEEQKRLMRENNLDFEKRLVETIDCGIDPNVRKQRFNQQAEIIRQIINSIDEKGNADTNLSYFSEESDERLALQRFPIKDAKQKSDLIYRLKTESIENYLRKMDDTIKAEQGKFVPEYYTFKILTEIQSYHGDKNIIKQAMQLKEQIKEIVFADIETKYSMETSLEDLTYWEQDALIYMNAQRIWDSPKIRRRLFYIMMEASVDRKGKHLQKYGNKYQCNTKFYQKLKFLARYRSI